MNEPLRDFGVQDLATGLEDIVFGPGGYEAVRFVVSGMRVMLTLRYLNSSWRTTPVNLLKI